MSFKYQNALPKNVVSTALIAESAYYFQLHSTGKLLQRFISISIDLYFMLFGVVIFRGILYFYEV